jgi:hypothetical protein
VASAVATGPVAAGPCFASAAPMALFVWSHDPVDRDAGHGLEGPDGVFGVRAEGTIDRHIVPEVHQPPLQRREGRSFRPALQCGPEHEGGDRTNPVGEARAGTGLVLQQLIRLAGVLPTEQLTLPPFAGHVIVFRLGGGVFGGEAGRGSHVRTWRVWLI